MHNQKRQTNTLGRQGILLRAINGAPFVTVMDCLLLWLIVAQVTALEHPPMESLGPLELLPWIMNGGQFVMAMGYLLLWLRQEPATV